MPSKVVHLVLRKSSNIGNTHCVAHWEALTIGDAFKAVRKLMILDDFANKVYSCVRRSCNWPKKLKSFMDSFDLLSLTILQFHLVHWFFRGQVLERSLYYMPTILDAFQVLKPYWYQEVTTFLFQFMLHLVVDVLMELNKLNKNFQYDMADILFQQLGVL
jgi:hypothetical protein